MGGESRNWDYRFIWVRDSSLAAKALMQEGYLVDGRGAMNFLLSVVEPTAKPFDHPPFYGVDGSPPPGDEEELPWLAGYGGGAGRLGSATPRPRSFNWTWRGGGSWMPSTPTTR